jgi:hypothetical protein
VKKLIITATMLGAIASPAYAAKYGMYRTAEDALAGVHKCQNVCFDDYMVYSKDPDYKLKPGSYQSLGHCMGFCWSLTQ